MKKLTMNMSIFLAVLKAKKGSILVILFVFVSILFLALLPYLLPLPEQNNLSGEEFVRQYNREGEFLETDNGRIYIKSNGSTADPAIVLVHGFGGSAVIWRTIAPQLAKKGYYVISIDIPPFGLSEKDATKAYSHESLAHTIKQVLDLKSIKKAIFIGHSMGANILLWYYKEYRGMVERLVFVDGNNNTENDILEFKSLLKNQYIFQSGRQLSQRLISKERIHALLTSATYKDEVVTEEMIQAYSEVYKTKDWDSGLLAFIRDSSRNNIPHDLLKTVTVPTLIIWGKEDSWIPLEEGIQFSRYFALHDLVVFSDIGHLPMEETPELFIITVSNFLKKENFGDTLLQ